MASGIQQVHLESDKFKGRTTCGIDRGLNSTLVRHKSKANITGNLIYVTCKRCVRQRKYHSPDTGFDIQVQSGVGFKKKSMYIMLANRIVYIPLTKKKMEEILSVFPDIPQEG